MELHTIRVADTVVVELTAKQFTDLHNKMTDYYNENYEELTKD